MIGTTTDLDVLVDSYQDRLDLYKAAKADFEARKLQLAEAESRLINEMDLNELDGFQRDGYDYTINVHQSVQYTNDANATDATDRLIELGPDYRSALTTNIKSIAAMLRKQDDQQIDVPEALQDLVEPTATTKLSVRKASVFDRKAEILETATSEALFA